MSRKRRDSGENFDTGSIGGNRGGNERNYDEDNVMPSGGGGGGGNDFHENSGGGNIFGGGGGGGSPQYQEESRGGGGNDFGGGYEAPEYHEDNGRGNSGDDMGNHYAYGNDNERGNSGRGNSGNAFAYGQDNENRGNSGGGGGGGYYEDNSNRGGNNGDQGNHYAYGNDNERGNSGNEGNHYAYGHDNSIRERSPEPMRPQPQNPKNPAQIQSSGPKPGPKPVVVNVNVNQPHPQARPQPININQTNIVHPGQPQARPSQQPVSYGPPVDANQFRPLPNAADLPPDNKTNVPNVPPPALRGVPPQYSGLSWNKRQVPPPPININSLLADAPQPKVDSNLMQPDEDAVKEAMIAHVAGECCYNPRCARECVITKVTPMSALHYKLETFTERRFISYEYVPYNNGPFDGPDRGPIPDPWGLQVNAGQPFSNGSRKMAVPHTDQIIGCFKCNSKGSLRCMSCNGSGGKVCGFCHGKRYRVDPQGNRDRCGMCNGSGTERCIRCSGRGSVTCSNCQGSGRLKVYIELEISFKNHLNDYIIEESALPDHLIKSVSGDTLVLQTFAQVQPIMNFPDRRIVESSRRIVESHRSLYSSEKPLMQRQELKAVSVTECEYQWKEFRSRFWVYGNERYVYLEDYPQKCCGCCCCCCTCCNCTII